MCKVKPEITKVDLGKCQKKVESLEQLITTYSGEKANNMKSSQTNLGVFSIGVENSNNGGDCSGFWGILEVIAAIGLFLLIVFILFKCISAYCAKRRHMRKEKQKKMVELLDRSWNDRERVNSKNTAIDMLAQNDMSYSRSRDHLHIPTRISQRGEAPALNQEMGQEIGPFE